MPAAINAVSQYHIETNEEKNVIALILFTLS